MQLFAALHIGGRFFPMQARPAYPGRWDNEQLDDVGAGHRAPFPLPPTLPPSSACRARRRSALSDRRLGAPASPPLGHSWQPEVHKNLKWAKVRWRLDEMRGGLCCPPSDRAAALPPRPRRPPTLPRARSASATTRNELRDQRVSSLLRSLPPSFLPD